MFQEHSSSTQNQQQYTHRTPVGSLLHVGTVWWVRECLLSISAHSEEANYSISVPAYLQIFIAIVVLAVYTHNKIFQMFKPFNRWYSWSLTVPVCGYSYCIWQLWFTIVRNRLNYFHLITSWDGLYQTFDSSNYSNNDIVERSYVLRICWWHQPTIFTQIAYTVW